jgi:dienelactone hydrolase
MVGNIMKEITFNSGEEGIIRYKSSNPFEFFHILNSKNCEEQEMFGSLILPEEKKSKYPLVICMHGSMGWRGHHHEHSVNFLKNGFAVFRVNSFDARGVTSIVEDQIQVTLATVMTDCFNALKILSMHPDIDSSKIFIAGWSLGGSVAIYSAWEPIAEKLAPEGERFAGHLAFYPGAFIWPEEMRWSKSSILTLIGADDDYTPASLVEELSPAINQHGGSSSVIVYENSHHSFDSIDPVIHVPNAIAVGRRHTVLSKDGSHYHEDKDGKRTSMNEPHERAQIFKDRAKVGAHLGRNWQARRASMKDSVDFLLSNID